MAEEFHQGIVCGSSDSWAFNNNPFPCSNYGFAAWPENPVKKTASDDSGAASDTSVVLQDPSVASDTLQMMGLCSSADWNQGLMPDNTQSGGYDCLQIHRNFIEDSFVSSLQQPSPDSLITAEPYTSFPANSPPYNYNSSLIQTLFESQALQSYTASYPMYSPHFLPELSEPTNFINPNYSLAKPQAPNNFQFTSSTPLCNPTAATLPNPPRPSPFTGANSNLRHTNTNKHHNKETTPDSKKKSTGNEAVGTKRARTTETPSLPAFKVRKEKLGDRITALQQLVSPFGKTDTASVLQEAIEYIKFLHDHVHTLTTPYSKNGTPPLQHQQATNNRIKDRRVAIQDLRSRGLCLVPASSTFPVTAVTTSDFWTPTFGGGAFR